MALHLRQRQPFELSLHDIQWVRYLGTGVRLSLFNQRRQRGKEKKKIQTQKKKKNTDMLLTQVWPSQVETPQLPAHVHYPSHFHSHSLSYIHTYTPVRWCKGNQFRQFLWARGPKKNLKAANLQEAHKTSHGKWLNRLHKCFLEC